MGRESAVISKFTGMETTDEFVESVNVKKFALHFLSVSQSLSLTLYHSPPLLLFFTLFFYAFILRSALIRYQLISIILLFLFLHPISKVNLPFLFCLWLLLLSHSVALVLRVMIVINVLIISRQKGAVMRCATQLFLIALS